jgi:hypothetical protein
MRFGRNGSRFFPSRCKEAVPFESFVRSCSKRVADAPVLYGHRGVDEQLIVASIRIDAEPTLIPNLKTILEFEPQETVELTVEDRTDLRVPVLEREIPVAG